MFYTALFYFLVALLLALTEIESEGKYGWAEKTETFAKKTKRNIFSLYSGATVVTGYHLLLGTFLFLFMHVIYFFGVEFNIVTELILISTFIIWTLFWDFLWFVLNPHYGWKNFTKEKVWWFQEDYWVFNKLPLKYFVQLGIAIFLIACASVFSGEHNLYIQQVLLINYLLIFTILAHFVIRPIYHKFYWRMNRQSNVMSRSKPAKQAVI